MARRKFTKTYSNPSCLVALLKSRGLEVCDERVAMQYLENVGYYRLSAYMYPFLKSPKTQHLYKQGATFDKVLMLYRFDKKLRILLLNEIEKIEIAIRGTIMNMTAEQTGDGFWLTNPVHFENPQKFEETLNLIEREYKKSKDDFIQHFKNTYVDSFPPAWILGELLTMGSANMVYRNLKEDRIRKKFLIILNFSPKFLNPGLRL